MASEKITAMIEEVKTLTVLELAELVHALEEEFGVSAAAARSLLCACRFFFGKHDKFTFAGYLRPAGAPLPRGGDDRIIFAAPVCGCFAVFGVSDEV